MRTLTVWIAAAAVFLALASSGQAQGPASSSAIPASSSAIKEGSRVSLEYTLSDDAGKVLDSNKGAEPFAYTQGAREIVPGLESALAGLKAGDVKKVTVKPEDGYGKVDPKAQMEVGRERVPPDVKVGTELTGRAPNGQARAVRVKEIKDKSVVLDLNHPLAGKTLVFDVLILRVDGP
jgi:FKBP-type peptidyl-prolyl cis-trans isomerase SlyD